MTTEQITCFFAAANSESFTEAAEKVYMTQPTFGRYISSLETELGFPLFVRSWKKYQITKAGRIMYEGLQKINHEMLELLSEARNVAGGIKGSVRFGLLEGQLMDEYLQEFLQKFRLLTPGVQVELERFSFREMLDSIAEHRLDIGITLTLDVKDREGFQYVPLYVLHNEIVLPSQHPLADKPDLSLADLAQETFIGVEKNESDVIYDLMRQSCLAAGFEPRMIRKKDLRSQIFAVESGEGIAAFNEYHQTCNHPGLIHISVPELPDVEFSAVWQEPFLNPAAERFAEMIRA